MDRLSQVRALVARKYPQLTEEQQRDLVDLVWKEAQRDLRARW